MNKGVGDGRRGDAGSFRKDLTNLVTWAHAHGAICGQIPALEAAQPTRHPSQEKTFLWLCEAGHAYYWRCGKSDARSREENEGARKRSGSAEAASRKTGLDEKRFRMTPFFERTTADAAGAGSWSRYPGVTQEDDPAHAIPNEPPARENQLKGKSPKPRVAAERRSSTSGGEAKADGCRERPGNNEDLKIIPDGERCPLEEGDRGDRVNQNFLSGSPEGASPVVDLRRQRSQRAALNAPTAPLTSACAPLTPACGPKSSTSNEENLESSFLRLSPPRLAGPETARNSSGSPAAKEFLQSVRVSSPEAKTHPDSPTSVTFFEIQATMEIQEQLQLSPSECGSPRTGSGGNAAEHPAEEAEPSGSGHAAHLSSLVSPGSENGDRPSASLSRSGLEKQERKRNRNRGNIKVFKDWLTLHHPSEMRKIYNLPPQDLNNYLASFYSSAKSQKGTDFSKTSLLFFQLSIERYLKEHEYTYSVVKGPEFRGAQEALRRRQQQLSQREREAEWSVVERLTEEDVDDLRRKELLSTKHPQGLLSLVLVNIIRGFGARTHREIHALYWGQLVLRRDQGELERLEWKDEPGAAVGAEEPAPRLFAKPDRPESCPVEDYKEYAKRRPPDACRAYDPLYLTPKPLCSTWDQVWFCRKSLGKAKLEKIFKVIIQQVKGAGKRPKN